MIADAPGVKLSELVGRYGSGLSRDARHCKALLADVCGNRFRGECAVLVAAVEEGVAGSLLSNSNGLPTEVVLRRLSDRLQANRGVSADMARWGVECWAVALGVMAGGSTLAKFTMDGLMPLIDLAGADGVISDAQLNRLIDEAKTRGVSEADARAYLSAYAAARGWQLGKPQAGSQPAAPQSPPPAPSPQQPTQPSPPNPQPAPHRSFRWAAASIIGLSLIGIIVVVATVNNQPQQTPPTPAASPAPAPPAPSPSPDQADREQRAYNGARGNAAALHAYVNSCSICTYAPAARSEISKLETADQEEHAYNDARGNLAALRAYVSTCSVCADAPAARVEIMKLETTAERPPPHLERDAEGRYHPEDGYRWASSAANDFNAVWVPGRFSFTYPDIVAGGMEGTWQPADGYSWLDGSVIGRVASEDLRVKRIQGNDTVQSHSHDGWWVIVGSFEGGHAGPREYQGIHSLAAQCNLEVFNDSSSKFIGFQPGFEVFVVGPYQSKPRAEDIRSTAAHCFSGTYLKYGHYTGAQINPQLTLPEQASLTPTASAYDQGLADRTAWERWYGNLSDSDFKKGAYWWSGQRNNKRGPCDGTEAAGNEQFTAGCNAAKAFFEREYRYRQLPVDNSDQVQYIAGWNAVTVPTETHQDSDSKQVPPSLAPTASAYDKGLADRTAWEGWYGNLSDSDFKRGAYWWSGQRNNKRGPCDGTEAAGNEQFVVGCNAAKAFFEREYRYRQLPIDNSDQVQYIAGWNAVTVPTETQQNATSASHLNSSELKIMKGNDGTSN